MMKALTLTRLRAQGYEKYSLLVDVILIQIECRSLSLPFATSLSCPRMIVMLLSTEQ